MMLRQFKGDEYAQRKYIEMKIKDICLNISQKGEGTSYEDIFQLLVEKIEDEETDV